MIPVAFDTETALIRPALLAPPMVCMTWQARGSEPYIRHYTEAESVIKGWLEDDQILIVGHFTAYDMTVVCAQFPRLIPLVFAAYKACRVTCTKKRQQLLDIAGGVFRGRPGDKGKWISHDYTLDALSRRHLGKPMQKDGWRLEYANFRDIPLERWPERAKEIQARSKARLDEIDAQFSFADQVALTKELEAEVKNLRAIVADVPEGVLRYPLDDASTTLGVYLAQEEHAEKYLRDQYRQAYADFALYLSSVWGLRTRAEGVDELRRQTEQALEEVQGDLIKAGLVREDGSRDTKAAKLLMIEVCRERGLPVRRTDAAKKCPVCTAAAEGAGPDECEEHVSLDSDACAAVATLGGVQVSEAGLGELDDQASDKSEIMGAYSEYSTLKKVLSTDLEMLASGVVYPVHTRYDIAETGRTTSSKPNIQNLRRLPGIREAFVPRPGHVFIQADYPQLELYTLAQCCYSWLGESKLGEALNIGLDPHLAMASTILGISYEDAQANRKRKEVDNARQTAKVANFGFPGGLGAAKLILFARKTYGVELSVTRAKQLKEEWYATWPEMRGYFARVNQLFPEGVERASIETLATERIRGGATYCAASNNGFQALGSDCAKRALCLIAEAQYTERTSPLFGTRTVAFVHDEIIAEAREEVAHAAAHELARLMVQGANHYLVNVPIKPEKMEPTIMRLWSKKAVQVFDAHGKLLPWG